MPDVAINQERFSSADVEVFMFGRVVPGVKAIDYKEAQDVNGVKAVGNRKDVGFTRGNYRVEGTITLYQEEILGLQVAAGGSILNLRGDVTVTMIRGGVTTKETLVGVVFKENSRQVDGASTDALSSAIPFYANELKVFK